MTLILLQVKSITYLALKQSDILKFIEIKLNVFTMGAKDHTIGRYTGIYYWFLIR